MRRPGPDEWMQLIEEYKNSGLQQKEFVAKHDLSLSTFQFWLYKKSKQRSVSLSKSPPAFLPIEVLASPAPQARLGMAGFIEASVRSGVVVRFAVGTNTRYVAELLAAIG